MRPACLFYVSVYNIIVVSSRLLYKRGRARAHRTTTTTTTLLLRAAFVLLNIVFVGPSAVLLKQRLRDCGGGRWRTRFARLASTSYRRVLPSLRAGGGPLARDLTIYHLLYAVCFHLFVFFFPLVYYNTGRRDL